MSQTPEQDLSTDADVLIATDNDQVLVTSESIIAPQPPSNFTVA